MLLRKSRRTANGYARQKQLQLGGYGCERCRCPAAAHAAPQLDQIRRRPAGLRGGYGSVPGAHHLGRLMRDFGHEVRLMSPEYVQPYVKAHKTDDRDAEAIAEAATRPTMRFVE